MRTSEEERLLHLVLDRLAGMPSELRQVLADHLWAQIAQDNFELAYSANQGANVALSVQPRTESIFRVETIVASVPSGATALVVVGDLTLPLPQGLSVVPFLRLQISRAATRAITTTGAGPTMLALSGSQLSGWGVLDR